MSISAMPAPVHRRALSFTSGRPAETRGDVARRTSAPHGRARVGAPEILAVAGVAFWSVVLGAGVMKVLSEVSGAGAF